MTRQEAIEKLQGEKVMSCYNCMHPMEVGWCENKCHLPEAYNMAIEALEKQDKYRWHDLRKDSEGYPEEYTDVMVAFLNGEILCYDTDYFVDSEWLHYKDENVIAWKEIELFEESEEE